MILALHPQGGVGGRRPGPARSLGACVESPVDRVAQPVVLTVFDVCLRDLPGLWSSALAYVHRKNSPGCCEPTSARQPRAALRRDVCFNRSVTRARKLREPVRQIFMDTNALSCRPE